MIKSLAWTLVTALVLTVSAGCGRNAANRPAAKQLEQSFEKAAAPVKQEIVQATSAFQAGNYTQAILIMDRVVQGQPVSEAQREAVDALIVQTRRAVQQDPKRDSPQLYKAMADLTLRLHGEN